MIQNSDGQAACAELKQVDIVRVYATIPPVRLSGKEQEVI